MERSGVRWTLALMALLSVLAVAGATYRSGETEGPPERKPAAASPVRPYGGSDAGKQTEATLPVVEIPPDPAPTARARVEHRKARDEGYREAREARWEGALSGQVVSSEGPVTGMTVRVEWVLAHEPDREQIAHLKRGGARRDRDGTWWGRSLVSTDESGCFTVDGLPAVPLRVHAGNVVQQAEVGSFVRITAERPQ